MSETYGDEVQDRWTEAEWAESDADEAEWAESDAELREESEADDPWPYADGTDSDDWKDWT